MNEQEVGLVEHIIALLERNPALLDWVVLGVSIGVGINLGSRYLPHRPAVAERAGTRAQPSAVSLSAHELIAIAEMIAIVRNDAETAKHDELEAELNDLRYLAAQLIKELIQSD